MEEPIPEQFHEKMQLNIDIELDTFIDTILKYCEFLTACEKSNLGVKDRMKNDIIKKFKITDSEVSFSALEMEKLLEDINSDYIYKTILELTDKGYLSMGISKEGKMTIEATEQTKNYMKLFDKELDKGK